MFEPTIKDIAKICGVGVSTVSRAINNHPDINPETKEKILSNIHNGAIILLHPTSKTNAAILDDVIKELQSKGFSFKTLDYLKKLP